MNRLVIRSLEDQDYQQWLPLWKGNNPNLENLKVTETTWRRLSDPQNRLVRGLCAERGGEMLGIAHYILHFTTGQINPVCYMQDVYVAPDYRRQGIGMRLVDEITAIAKKEGWARLYWITQNDNQEAKAMYKNFGIKLDHDLYVLPINPS